MRKRNKVKISQALLPTTIALVLVGSVGSFAAARKWDSIDLKNNLIEVQVVPQIGGRIIQYKLGDYGFFWVNDQLAGTEPPATGVGPKGEWLNYGGDKMWPAPQGWDNDRQWPGPPDPVLDGEPYAAEVIEKQGQPATIRLTSQKDKRSGIQFSRLLKTFDGTTHVSIDATMTNIDTKPRRWGIWTVTQFDTRNRHGDGYNQNFRAYCPLNPRSKLYKGYRVLYGVVNNTSFKPDYENQMMRVNYQHRVGKIGLDSSAGWVATVDAANGYAFVHRFTYEADKPYPDDSSVEFWCNGLGEFVAWGKVNKMPEDPKDNPYLLETEILSPFANLQPGQSYTFHYDWYAAKVPPDFPVVACSDVGVTCQPLTARLRGRKLVLSGGFGVFYKANCCPVLLDANGNKIKELGSPVPVNPLEPLVVSGTAESFGDTDIPASADKIALYLYDAEEQMLGELAGAKIQR
ncbi:MAG TPA: DUF4380 domain-containing protein [Sedimentisphaerales bacterium]|nr:DUF4380 domain-containing protein [Sedimentisphaerales bacterium]